MKFSVIVPVFNVERYLPECIESIISQSFHDYEVILVDDGSTDDSGKLCDIYAKQYVQFRVIHQENSGLSIARNAGISIAKGEYMLFVDSDDRLGSTLLLEQLALEVKECDIVTFAWKEIPDGKNADDYEICVNLNCLEKKYENGKDYLDEALKCYSLYPWYPWIYTYSRKFWNDHGFEYEPGIKYEDVDLTYRVILAAKQIKVLAGCVGYYYRTRREGSIVTEVNNKTYYSTINVIANNIKRVQALAECSAELKEKLMNNFSCLYYAVLIQSSKIKDKKKQRELWDYLRKYNWICSYTKEPQQRIVKKIISIIGIPNTAKLLAIRRKIQYISRR